MNVLITGAARGLGLALTKKFSKEGHHVWAGVRNIQKAKELQDFAKEQSNVKIVELDVASWTSIKEATIVVGKKIDELDILINNAGVLFEEDKSKKIMEVNPDILRYTLAVNVEGPILVTKAFYPLLKNSFAPKVFTITSESSIVGNWSGMPVYSLSKVAAGKAMGILRASVGENWQVLAIHPGRMDTDMGHATAQIQPETAAEGIFEMAVGKVKPENWYVNYLGKKMEA